jgi:hypothetical protein
MKTHISFYWKQGHLILGKSFAPLIGGVRGRFREISLHSFAGLVIPAAEVLSVNKRHRDG